MSQNNSDDSTDSTESETPPAVKDHPGKWDEYGAMAILLLPFAGVAIGAVGFGVLVFTGVIQLNITVAGTIPVRTLFAPIWYGFWLALGAVYLLAMVKVFGRKAVEWVGRIARDYNPPER